MSTEMPLYDALWNYGKPEETAVKFRQHLETITFEDDPSAYLQLLTQLARTQSLQSRFADAHKILDDVETELNEQHPIATIRYLLERGRTFNSDNKKTLARPLFIKAYEQSKAADLDFYTIDAAHMVAIAEETSEGIMRWNLIAMEAANQTANKRARQWIGSLSNNIGWTYFDQGQYQEALEMFQRTQTFYINDNPNAERERIARWCIGKTYRLLGQLDKSLAIQKELHEEYVQLQQDDGYVQEELGECLLALDKQADAAPHFAEAYRILSQDKWLQANESDRLNRLQQLANS